MIYSLSKAAGLMRGHFQKTLGYFGSVVPHICLQFGQCVISVVLLSTFCDLRIEEIVLAMREDENNFLKVVALIYWSHYKLESLSAVFIHGHDAPQLPFVFPP